MKMTINNHLCITSQYSNQKVDTGSKQGAAQKAETVKRTSDVSEIKPKSLTPLEQVFEEIKKIALEAAETGRDSLQEYLFVRNQYMGENISVTSPTRTEIVKLLEPIAVQMSLDKAKHLFEPAEEDPNDFLTMAIRAIFPDEGKNKKPDDLFSDLSMQETVTLPVNFTVGDLNVSIDGRHHITVCNQNGEQILTYSAPPSAGGWTAEQTMAEKMFIKETNLLYRKAYDAARERIEARNAEQAALVSKPALNVRV